MDSNNLMEFNSPSSVKLNNEIRPSTSPGGNPFDTLSKRVQSNIVNETQFTTYNLIDFTSDSQTWGRKSLTALNDFDCGRESLGILKLEALNTSLSTDEVPSIFVTSVVNSPLNAAFLCSNTGSFEAALLHPHSNCSRKTILSSSSSMSMNPSLFNSDSLERSEPSKIYSLNLSRYWRIFSVPSEHLEDLNRGFMVSNTFPESSFEDYSCQAKQRLLSLPDFSSKLEVCSEEKEQLCRSESKSILEKHPENVQGKECDEFNDSVFIEANYWASKIADGSIVLENSKEGNLLDNTNPPELFEDVEAFEADVKLDTETVFKCIDKMLPPSTPEEHKTEKQDENEPISPHEPTEVSKCSSGGSGCDSTSKSKNAKELLQNLSEIINNGQNTNSRRSVEGQRLLNSLADILCQSRSTVDSLEDSGHSSIETEDQWNDQDQQHNCYDVLDLRITSKSNDEQQALDLSVKTSGNNKRLSQSFSFRPPKLPPAKPFNVRTASMGTIATLEAKSESDPGRLKQKVNNRSGVVKKGPLKAVIPLGNMSKQASFGGSGSSTAETPPKASRQSKLLKMNRTSTPITEHKLKPEAQSTPNTVQATANIKKDKLNACSSQLKKRKFYCPISPLTRPNSIDASINMKTSISSCSGSTPNLSNRSTNAKLGESLIPSPKNMLRRHSASELKSTENPLKLKRCFSTGKDHKSAPSVAGKVKQGISSVLSNMSPSRRSSLKSSGQSKNSLQEKNTAIGTLNKMKPSNVFSKLKKSSLGKENVTR